MLMPKRVKFRKAHRGRRAGKATRGHLVNFGDYGLKALEPAWITSRQIEACRVALSRHMKRDGKMWIRIFPDKPVTKNLLKQEWVKEKGHPNFGLPLLNPEESCLRSAVLIRKPLTKQWQLLLTSCQ